MRTARRPTSILAAPALHAPLESTLSYEGGVREFVRFLDRSKTSVIPDPIYVVGERDDITILIVGHIIVPLMLLWEKTSPPPLWAHYAVWMPATLVLTLALLPRVKGAWIGLMWAGRLRCNEVQ